jgi:hypothetical protein
LGRCFLIFNKMYVSILNAHDFSNINFQLPTMKCCFVFFSQFIEELNKIQFKNWEPCSTKWHELAIQFLSFFLFIIIAKRNRRDESIAMAIPCYPSINKGDYLRNSPTQQSQSLKICSCSRHQQVLFCLIFLTKICAFAMKSIWKANDDGKKQQHYSIDKNVDIV